MLYNALKKETYTNHKIDVAYKAIDSISKAIKLAHEAPDVYYNTNSDCLFTHWKYSKMFLISKQLINYIILLAVEYSVYGIWINVNKLLGDTKQT